MSGEANLRNDPVWFKDVIFYEIYVRGFYDSHAGGIGDFRGLTGKLDYPGWLGVDCICLLPMYASPLRDLDSPYRRTPHARQILPVQLG